MACVQGAHWLHTCVACVCVCVCVCVCGCVCMCVCACVCCCCCCCCCLVVVVVCVCACVCVCVCVCVRVCVCVCVCVCQCISQSDRPCFIDLIASFRSSSTWLVRHGQQTDGAVHESLGVCRPIEVKNQLLPTASPRNSQRMPAQVDSERAGCSGDTKPLKGHARHRLLLSADPRYVHPNLSEA